MPSGLNQSRVGKSLAIVALAVLSAGGAAAQSRDPAYAAARAEGRIGEKPDGYLGVVGAGSPALHAMVDDLNIKRRAVYADRAQAQHATVEEYAFTTGCGLIAKTSPGEKYQASGGAWETRGGGAPARDARCP